MLHTTHIYNEGFSALWPIHQAYSSTCHLDTTTLLQQKFICEHSDELQCFTSINQPCIYQWTCAFMCVHAHTHTHTHTHTLTHTCMLTHALTHTHPPFSVKKLPVCETSFLLNVNTRTQTSTVKHLNMYVSVVHSWLVVI